MDFMSPDVQKHLNGYTLPPDDLWEIKRALERRYRTRFSEGLSPEGQMAMQQAQEREADPESENKDKVKVKKTSKSDKSKRKQSDKRPTTRNEDDKRKRTISFSDTYKNSSANRLEGDITDESFDAASLKKRAIGGKLENAMETIEIVTHGEEGTKSLTGDPAIDETAKLNSVEKCIVWMEVNDDVNNNVNAHPSPLPDTARSDNSMVPAET